MTNVRPTDPNATREVNFDGLVGPTHNYGGLSEGNLASTSHRAAVAHPREAALQGLEKMRFLARLGLRQALVPPLERPALHVLRGLGFSGDDENVLRTAWRDAPALAAACTSASSMWTANAVTVTPSADAGDGRVHFTPANLARNFHRAIEAPDTASLWRQMFPDAGRFTHHPPLAGGAAFADEGAANHTRFSCPGTGGGARPGLHLFVFGGSAFQGDLPKPGRFPARQTLEASQAVARRHGLPPERAMFVQQNPAAIDAGVFHNDVIATGNDNLLLYHEEAFVDGAATIAELRRRFRELQPAAAAGRVELLCVQVPARELSLADAVGSYLFNSQVVTLPDPDAGMALIAPAECRENPAVLACIERWLQDGDDPIRAVHYFDLRQSMRNGGGPACLRQRVVLSGAELAGVPAGLFMEDDASHARLAAWVRRHYRETLTAADLRSPDLLGETRAALDELTGLLGLGGDVYEFQRAGA